MRVSVIAKQAKQRRIHMYFKFSFQSYDRALVQSARYRRATPTAPWPNDLWLA